MARKRNPRVDKQVRAAIADLIETEISDPRLVFVTITDVDVTPDHEVATVHYSSLEPELVRRDPRRTGGDRVPQPEAVAEGLRAAAPRLRSLLGRRVGLRVTPELRFVVDPVTSRASRIDELLRNIDTNVEVPPGTGGIDLDDVEAGDDR